MIPRSELAEMLADLELSEVAVMAIVDADAELAWLEAGLEGAPDAAARAEMVEELRAMMREVGA